MSDLMQDIQKWGTSTAQKLIETWLFGKSSSPTPAPVAPESNPSTLKKWLPYGLIGGALVAALFFFKGKK